MMQDRRRMTSRYSGNGQFYQVPQPEKKPEFNLSLGAFLLILVIGSVIYFTCTGSEKKEVKPNKPIEWTLVNKNATPAQIEKTKEIIKVFQKNCLGIQKYPESVESATISFSDFYDPKLQDYRKETYGWRMELEINIKVKEKAQIPSDWHAWGYNLHYYLGGKEHPGIIIQKDQSAFFFGLSRDQIVSGNDTFISVPELKMVDEL